MTDYERELLQTIIDQNDEIIRQNDLILRYVRVDLGVDVRNSERDIKMAKSFEEVKAVLAEQTDISKAMRIQITHNNEVMDDIAARLKEAGTNQQALDELHASIVSTNQEMKSGKEELVQAALRDTPFDPSAN